MQILRNAAKNTSHSSAPAYPLFCHLYGKSLLPSLGIQEIPANDIIRNKSLHCIIFQEFAGQEGNHKYSRSKYHS